MAARSFFDANVLVYTDDQDARRKQTKALELVEEARLGGWGVVSTQILQEYFVAATTKLRVPPEIARRKVELFGRLDLVLIDLPDILAAVDLLRLHAISFWDALVLRAAHRAGCTVLLTEDLQHGARYDGVEVRNPFRTT
jgi:predicted nucleic acid-binding protein